MLAMQTARVLHECSSPGNGHREEERIEAFLGFRDTHELLNCRATAYCPETGPTDAGGGD
jgi:hypothetical protein